MGSSGIISELKQKLPGFDPLAVKQIYPDEIRFRVEPKAFKGACLVIHKLLSCPVMTFFAVDERFRTGNFKINCVFLNARSASWLIISMDIPGKDPAFDSLAKDMHSAGLFEREMKEMFGIMPTGSPDLRRLHLHDEVWPADNYPLRKDFKKIEGVFAGEYTFGKVEGEGVFEVPVGPVHAGIIGPGHFRFSLAGEPIINLESRLGFTHRGIEKLFEGRTCFEAIAISERVSGDSAFAQSTAFAMAAEKISGTTVPLQSVYLRALFLELERMYNHVNDIGGIALDVGFSFPAAYASILKETILQLNEKLTGSRYLKGVNQVGGIILKPNEAAIDMLKESLGAIRRDFDELTGMLYSSVSFMDRVDTTGVLKRKTAEDLGIVGPAARASGIRIDLRECFSGVHKESKFKMSVEQSGDVLARLKIRISEFKESSRLISHFLEKIDLAKEFYSKPGLKAGSALGYVEGWRGPVLYWLMTDEFGVVERCKITDPSFHNWQGLSYAVLGNIIPDFPLCNKSFDLSYSGNDL